MFNLGSSYFHVALTTVRHLLNVTKRGLDTSRQLAVIEQRSLLTRRSNRKNKNNFRWGQMSGEGRGGCKCRTFARLSATKCAFYSAAYIFSIASLSSRVDSRRPRKVYRPIATGDITRTAAAATFKMSLVFCCCAPANVVYGEVYVPPLITTVLRLSQY